MSTQPIAPASTCACANLRSTTRIITQLYDSFLQPSGLQTSQYSLLNQLARVESISITRCAQSLGMDRTTLTRNLDPLLRQGLVARTQGQDQRIRLVQITASGRERLAAAYPLWQQAQEYMIASFGQARFQALLGELAALTAVVQPDPHNPSRRKDL